MNNAKATTATNSFPELLDSKPASPSGDAGLGIGNLVRQTARHFQYRCSVLEDQLFTFPSASKTTVRKCTLAPTGDQ